MLFLFPSHRHLHANRAALPCDVARELVLVAAAVEAHHAPPEVVAVVELVVHAVARVVVAAAAVAVHEGLRAVHLLENPAEAAAVLRELRGDVQPREVRGVCHLVALPVSYQRRVHGGLDAAPAGDADAHPDSGVLLVPSSGHL